MLTKGMESIPSVDEFYRVKIYLLGHQMVMRNIPPKKGIKYGSLTIAGAWSAHGYFIPDGLLQSWNKKIFVKKAVEPGADILCPDLFPTQPLARTIIQNRVQNSLKVFIVK